MEIAVVLGVLFCPYQTIFLNDLNNTVCKPTLPLKPRKNLHVFRNTTTKKTSRQFIRLFTLAKRQKINGKKS